MKGRLYRWVLLAMLFTVDGEKSFTRNDLILLNHSTIRKIARMLHQDIAHVFRSEKQHHWHPSEVNGCHISIGLLKLLKKAQWVLSQREKVADIGQPSWTRREGCFCCLKIFGGGGHLLPFSLPVNCSLTPYYVS